MLERAVHDEGSEIPPGLNGLSSIDARRLLGEVGPNRWVKQDRFARVREVVSLLLDPMAVMLIIAAVVPASRPQKPDFIDARRQNMPMMKTTNIGTLKKENRVWR